MDGISAGTRTRAERLLRPQQMYDGASCPAANRTYEFTHWLVTAVMSPAWCNTPATNCRATWDRWYSAEASKKAFRSPSNRETWVCIPLPGASANGFGMKEAWIRCEAATSFTTTRKVMMLSAMVSASA